MAMERELALRTEATFFGKKLDCEVKDKADAVKAAKSRPRKDFIMTEGLLVREGIVSAVQQFSN